MAKTATNELRNMETEELENKLTEVRQEHFNLRFQLVTGQLMPGIADQDFAGQTPTFTIFAN